MLTVERQSSSVSVLAVSQLQSVHLATSASDATVRHRRRHRRPRSRCSPAARPAVPREPRSPVRRRLGRRIADVRRYVQLPERTEQPDLSAPAATEHCVGRHSHVTAGDALYRRRRRCVAYWQPGFTAKSTQRRGAQRCHDTTRSTCAAAQGTPLLKGFK